MNRRRLSLVSLLMICFAAGVALAQQNVPPPPKPPDNGPSLADTMKFIQEKLNGLGPINFVVFAHDDVAGNDWTYQRKVEISNLVADSHSCIVQYHFTVTDNGTVRANLDAGIPLKAVENIIVTPEGQRLRETDTAEGHPSYSSRVEPPVFVLKTVRSNNGGLNEFYFPDEDLANRVAKAMVHAVELCGGGNKEPF
jgi:hypothetical protein